MRHRKTGLKLNRTASHRDAMFRNMVTSLFKHQRIRTTDAKAKELRRWADRLITLAKRGDLHARRQALAIMREKGVVHKLFEDAPNRYGKTSGGYTRVIKIGRRAGDAAPISIVELVTPETVSIKPKKKTVKKKEKTPVSDEKKVKSTAKSKKEEVTAESTDEDTEQTDAADEMKGIEEEKTPPADSSDSDEEVQTKSGENTPEDKK